MNDNDLLSYDIFQVSNPFAKPYTTHWNSVAYTIPAKGTKLLPKFIAEKAAYELAELKVQKEGKGIEAILNKTLMAKETAKLLRLVQAASPKSVDTLASQLERFNEENGELQESEVNPESLDVIEQDEQEERISTKDNRNPNAELAQDITETQEEEVDTTDEDETDFPEVGEEDDLREAQKENLERSNVEELKRVAKEAGIRLPRNATKNQIVDAILDHNSEEN